MRWRLWLGRTRRGIWKVARYFASHAAGELVIVDCLGWRDFGGDEGGEEPMWIWREPYKRDGPSLPIHRLQERVTYALHLLFSLGRD